MCRQVRSRLLQGPSEVGIGCGRGALKPVPKLAVAESRLQKPTLRHLARFALQHTVTCDEVAVYLLEDYAVWGRGSQGWSTIGEAHGRRLLM